MEGIITYALSGGFILKITDMSKMIKSVVDKNMIIRYQTIILLLRIPPA